MFKKKYKKYYDKFKQCKDVKNEPPKKELNNNKLLDFSVIFDEDEEQNWEEELNNYLDAPCAPEYINSIRLVERARGFLSNFIKNSHR